MNIPSWILAGAAVLSLVNVVLIGWIIWSINWSMPPPGLIRRGWMPRSASCANRM